jgi:hypothetical protein
MRFPAVVFLAVCGAFLVIGGVLIGSGTTASIGVVLWAVAAALTLQSAVRFLADAWHDWRLKREMAEIRKGKTEPRYSRNVGLR